MNIFKSNIRDWETVIIYVSNNVFQIKEWCGSNFGKRWDVFDMDGVWTMFWNGDSKEYKFYFKYEKDATLFLLRWS